MAVGGLWQKEEEYKRINAALEAKTASLLQEAEQVMQEAMNSARYQKAEDSTRTTLLDNIDPNALNEDAMDERYSSSKDNRKEGNLSAGKEARPRKRRNAATAVIRHNVDDVAVPDMNMSDVRTVISNLEQEANTNTSARPSTGTLAADVIPQEAQQLSSEAQIRFLKAKVRVMQEELDKVVDEVHKKEDESNSLLKQLKDSEEDRQRLQRTIASQQVAMEKLKGTAEESKRRADGLETELHSLKKELDKMRRGQKQQQTSQNTLEVRLNRAQEEIDKYKSLLQKTKASAKDGEEQERKKVERLLADNKRLEKQKAELVTGFKKQLKLIDVLKRQKLHVEAATMLRLTEEEFMKALEWTG